MNTRINAYLFCLVILAVIFAASACVKSDDSQILAASEQAIRIDIPIHERIQQTGDTAEVDYFDNYQITQAIAIMRRDDASGQWMTASIRRPP